MGPPKFPKRIMHTRVLSSYGIQHAEFKIVVRYTCCNGCVNRLYDRRLPSGIPHGL